MSDPGNDRWRRALAIGTLIVLFIGLAVPSLAAAADGREPLTLTGAKEFYQRVITKPDAVLRVTPGVAAADSAASLPAFSIFYVFARKTLDGREWVEVGRQAHGNTDGWLPADDVQDWTMTLVMQFAAPGQRQRVLFFERKPELLDLVDAVEPRQAVDAMIRAADGGRNTDMHLVAVEPKRDEGAVSFEKRPYVMPIVNHDRAVRGRTPVTLVEIAAINASKPPPAAAAPPKTASADSLKKQRIGIAFVIDTSISMQPFIDLARQTIASVYGILEREQLLDRTSFALIGYRNNMDEEPQRSQLEYVYRIFQPLNAAAPVNTILANMQTMREAKVSTHSFAEDAMAGLHAAIDDLDWRPYDARLIVLVTDASALDGADPKAKFRNEGEITIADTARRKDIAIVPIHLQSDAAKRAGDIDRARKQYGYLGLNTGDPNNAKYIPIEGASKRSFQENLQQLEQKLAETLRRSQQGLPAEKVERQSSANAKAAGLGDIIVNELFSAQLRYIGEVRGTATPSFFRGWASDKDLVNAEMHALDVRVFLTRNQLNQLALSLKRILDQAKAGTMSTESLFSLLQSLAAATVQDPERYKAGFSRIGESGLLPAFIELLPYESKLVGISADMWRNMAKSQREAIIDELDYKLRAYQQTNEDTNVWIDLVSIATNGAKKGDPGEEVYPVPLEVLP